MQILQMEPTKVMASRKGRRRNQHDGSRDGDDLTTITNVPQ